MNKTKQAFARLMAAAALMALANCGGGGGGVQTITGSNGSGIAPEAEPTVASGPLTGLGPLGVAGASFEDTTTQVLLNVNVAGNADSLRLGMTANTNGTAVTTGAGKAFGAVAQSLVRGPATSVDRVANRIAVLSIALRVDQNTLLEGINSLADLAVGDEVEGFGLALAGNQGALATRLIVKRPAGPTVEVLGTVTEPGVSSVVVQGIPVNLANARIGMTSTAGVAFAGTTPASLTLGMLIRVVGTYDAVSGVITATTVVASLAPARPEGNRLFIEGFVRDLTAMTRFRLPDIEVEGAALPAALSSITIGTRVRVRGTIQAGLLKAEAIEIIQATARTELVVEGEVAGFTSTAAFQVRGELIDATPASFTDGSAGNLANGRRVRVKAVAGPGRLVASEVVFITQ